MEEILKLIGISIMSMLSAYGVFSLLTEVKRSQTITPQYYIEVLGNKTIRVYSVETEVTQTIHENYLLTTVKKSNP